MFNFSPVRLLATIVAGIWLGVPFNQLLTPMTKVSNCETTSGAHVRERKFHIHIGSSAPLVSLTGRQTKEYRFLFDILVVRELGPIVDYQAQRHLITYDSMCLSRTRPRRNGIFGQCS